MRERTFRVGGSVFKVWFNRSDIVKEKTNVSLTWPSVQSVFPFIMWKMRYET